MYDIETYLYISDGPFRGRQAEGDIVPINRPYILQSVQSGEL